LEEVITAVQGLDMAEVHRQVNAASTAKNAATQ